MQSMKRSFMGNHRQCILLVSYGTLVSVRLILEVLDIILATRLKHLILNLYQTIMLFIAARVEIYTDRNPAQGAGTGNWADAYTKARSLVGQMTQIEKVANNTTHLAIGRWLKSDRLT